MSAASVPATPGIAEADLSAAMLKAISAEFSENKRRRGQPRVTPAALEALYRMYGIFEATTRRGNLNEYYRQRAFETLINPDAGIGEFVWLWDLSNNRIKRTLIVELGRIEDPETMISVARQLCAEKPKTQEAVARIRAWRTGKAAPAETIVDCLAGAVERYLAAHPGITYDAVIEAIDVVREAIEQLAHPEAAK